MSKGASEPWSHLPKKKSILYLHPFKRNSHIPRFLPMESEDFSGCPHSAGNLQLAGDLAVAMTLDPSTPPPVEKHKTVSATALFFHSSKVFIGNCSSVGFEPGVF